MFAQLTRACAAFSLGSGSLLTLLPLSIKKRSLGTGYGVLLGTLLACRTV